MQMRIVDMTCPICGSHETRSKVGDEAGKWWYICDNEDCPREIIINYKAYKFTDYRFYFTKEYRYPYIEVDGYRFIKMNRQWKLDYVWNHAPLKQQIDDILNKTKMHINSLNFGSLLR